MDEYKKSEWGDGPWHNEPDRFEWSDKETGLVCIARRGPMGAWCGYVGVSPTHPAHGLHYDGCSQEDADARMEYFHKNHKKIMTADYESPQVPTIPGVGEAIQNIRVHGRLTYSGTLDLKNGYWFFGFDCSHAGDFTPGMYFTLKKFYSDKGDLSALSRFVTDSTLGSKNKYRDLEYTKRECVRLAKQLSEIKTSRDLLTELLTSPKT